MKKLDYKIKIGLEIHVQLKTKSKMFCGCDNRAEGKAPNTVVCPICMGMPGVLPVPNSQAIDWALMTALALGCAINPLSKFDRKNYFYPDLPKGYQISQYDLPIGEGGKIEYFKEKDRTLKKSTVRINRVHLEEDAGKLIHSRGESLVDLNRVGTPLLEIVTEPDLDLPEDAKVFLQTLRQMMQHLSISDADMEKGHLRCDANINLKLVEKGKSFVTPITEIKNLNSFKAVEQALNYEAKRQYQEFKKTREVKTEGTKTTRGWDENKGKTVLLRAKEEEADYRYFPEPDLPNLEFSKVYLDRIKTQIPQSPQEKLQWLIKDLKISYKDAWNLVSDLKNFEHFKETMELGADPIATLKLIQNLYARFKSRYKIFDFKDFGIKPEYTKSATTLLSRFSNQIQQAVIEEMFETKHDPEYIIKERGYKTISGKDIERTVETVIKENSKACQDYEQGKEQALKFLIGAVMKKTKGQADPKTIKQLLEKLLK